MKNGPNRMCGYPDDSVPALGSRRRRHKGRHLVRFHPRCNLAWAFVVGLAAALTATDHAVAQEPMVHPPIPNAYPAPGLLHRLCHCLSPNDGIPRTFSYYYTPWLNQPCHFRVVRPDGTTYLDIDRAWSADGISMARGLSHWDGPAHSVIVRWSCR